ncbi:MAG TPA: DUF2723 domain-containing protein [Longimicrobium sp.]|nr:DUF2723 domain-containing protein [Longimicrobium sp.]
MSQPAQTATAARTPRDAAGTDATVHRPPYLAALGVSAALFVLYLVTLAPTTAFWDTSEYIATGHILGVPHPPGNPPFVLLAKTWSLLLAPFGLSIAQRINLFSALMTAGASFFWFLVTHRILVAFTASETVRRVGAAAAVWVSGTAFTVWNQSNVNEKVYTVTLITIAAMSWIAFLWRDHVDQHTGLRATAAGKRFKDDNAILLVVYLLAVSVGNHLMAFLAAPALFVFLILVKPRALTNWRLYPLAAGFATLGLLMQLYLPIRANLDPVINEASPKCESVAAAVPSVLTMGRVGTCEDLAAVLRREQYQKPPVGERMAPFHHQMANFFQYFDWQWSRSLNGRIGYFGSARMPFTLLFLGLGIAGAVANFRRDRKSFWYMAVLFGTLSLGLVFYMNFRYGYTQVRELGLEDSRAEVRERDYFYIITFSVWGLWVGVGLTALWLKLAALFAGMRNRLLLASPVLALALIPLGLNWKYATRTGDYAARDFAYNMLQSVEPYGVLITNGDNDTFPLWYAQEVEGVRRDVTVIVMSYLNTPWYTKQLRELTKPCPTPDAPLRDPTRIICQRPYEPSRGVAPYGNPRPPTKSIIALGDVEIDAISGRGYEQYPQEQVFEARGIQTTIPAGQVLTAADIFLLNIISHAWGDRPIHFAATTNSQFELNLVQHTARNGLSFKLVNAEDARGMTPIGAARELLPVTGAYMDLERNKFLHERVFQWRGMPGRAVWSDDATRNIPMQYVYSWGAIATVEDMRGNRAAGEQYMKRAEAFQALARDR